MEGLILRVSDDLFIHFYVFNSHNNQRKRDDEKGKHRECGNRPSWHRGVLSEVQIGCHDSCWNFGNPISPLEHGTFHDKFRNEPSKIEVG